MGILNATPDSFSDGGRFVDVGAGVGQAELMAAQGADIIDVGGESTRPGAERVGAAEQIRRTEPLVREIRAALGDRVAISIDTTLAPVAEAALEAGATIVNDVSAGLEDPGILGLAAERGAGLVLMHRLRPPDTDRFSNAYARDERPEYDDVVREVGACLRDRIAAAEAAGVASAAIVADPGLGFGKTVEQNLELIRRTDELVAMLGRAVLSGVSRKSFVGVASGLGDGSEPGERLAGTIGLSVAHVLRGASVLRVHDVGPVREAVLAATR